MQKPHRYRVHRARRYGLSEPHGEDCSEPRSAKKRAACAALLPMVRRDSDRDDSSWCGLDRGETEEEMKGNSLGGLGDFRCFYVAICSQDEQHETT